MDLNKACFLGGKLRIELLRFAECCTRKNLVDDLGFAFCQPSSISLVLQFLRHVIP